MRRSSQNLINGTLGWSVWVWVCMWVDGQACFRTHIVFWSRLLMNAAKKDKEAAAVGVKLAILKIWAQHDLC